MTEIEMAKANAILVGANDRIKRGAIFAEEAYALAKMLDHSAWLEGDKHLPRNITPSDIDMTIDNDGYVIFCELTSGKPEWRLLNRGQVLLYMNVISGSEKHCAVIVHHDVKPSDGRKICSRKDIKSFQIMIWRGKDAKGEDDFAFSKVLDGNSLWQKFIFAWMENPNKVIQKLLNQIPVETNQMEKICAQCGGGPTTDPPTDEPMIPVAGGWLHAECHRFYKPEAVNSVDSTRKAVD